MRKIARVSIGAEVFIDVPDHDFEFFRIGITVPYYEVERYEDI